MKRFVTRCVPVVLVVSALCIVFVGLANGSRLGASKASASPHARTLIAPRLSRSPPWSRRPPQLLWLRRIRLFASPTVGGASVAPSSGVPSSSAPAAPASLPPEATPPTDPGPPPCDWANFSTTVSTDQSSYAPGQTVAITLMFKNTGAACTVNATGYACPRVDVDDASGTLVWSSAAPVSTGCASQTEPPTVLEARWTQTFQEAWAQVSCTPGNFQGCPGPPVPAGQFEVFGIDAGGASRIPASAPVGVTITGSN